MLPSDINLRIGKVKNYNNKILISSPSFKIGTSLTLSDLGGGGADSTLLMFFFHHPETAQAMKLKLSDFKDTCLRHILQVIPGCYILRCYHGNKITKGTLQNLTQ